jgi:hypothetical protein
MDGGEISQEGDALGVSQHRSEAPPVVRSEINGSQSPKLEHGRIPARRGDRYAY